MKGQLVFLMILLGSLSAIEFSIPSMLHINKDNLKPDMKHLHGRVKMGDQFWETDCQCSKKPTGLKGQACNPIKMKLFMDKKGLGMDAKELMSYIGKVKKLDWTKISSSSFSCVDGRRKDNLLSKP